jgi:MFS family permease
MDDVAESPPAPFSIPIFRNVWAANSASNFGGMIQSVGAAWLMLSMTHSPVMVSLVQSTTTAPIMLLSLVAGAVADSYDRRVVMLRAQTFMLLVSVALAVCAWLGMLGPWLLLAFTFLIGCGNAFNAPAWQASVGDLVPRRSLHSAVALNAMGFNIARSAGPAVGGAIVAAFGAATAFATNAVSYVGLIFVLARWKPAREPQGLPREALFAAVGTGLRYVAMTPALRSILPRAMLFGFASVALNALLPVIARDQLGGGALTFGILSGAFGLGAVAGALAGGRLRKALSTEMLVRIATAAAVVCALVIGFVHVVAAAIPALFIGGAGWVLALSTFNASVQMSVPRWVVARAVALYQMLTFGGMAVGSWTFGAIAEHGSIEAALMVGAGLQVVGLLAGLVRPLPEVANLNLDPTGRWTEPETIVHVDADSGPVAVTIDYRIAPADADAFVAEMAERRRIRRRDGARNWTLLRDLADPELWIERYTVPTWLDYVRHNQRRTHADTENSRRIRELHRGDAPPLVHRMLEHDTAHKPAGERLFDLE